MRILQLISFVFCKIIFSDPSFSWKVLPCVLKIYSLQNKTYVYYSQEGVWDLQLRLDKKIQSKLFGFLRVLGFWNSLNNQYSGIVVKTCFTMCSGIIIKIFDLFVRRILQIIFSSNSINKLNLILVFTICFFFLIETQRFYSSFLKKEHLSL